MKLFEDMNLPPQISAALEAMDFLVATPIQAEAIPVALSGRDLIGCAQTGTGKTAAFGIPTIAKLLKTPQKLALVLVPTRELAIQIDEVLNKLTRKTPEISSVILIGGTPMQPQIRKLSKKPRIIIATPGRLVDHLRRGTVALNKTEILILDEADRMLDMGFAPQLEQILRFLPNARQTLLFSATFPQEIQKLAMKFLKDPARITIGTIARPVEKINQTVVHTTGQKKNETLLDQINSREGSVLIFARTKHRTDRVAKYLSSYNLPVTRIHGDRSQGQRNQAIQGFKSGTYRILVATDIAARGLDIPHIAHVINYDLPQQPEDYVHRIGRTARAGAEGEALCILIPEDKPQWQRITKLIGKNIPNHAGIRPH